MARLKAEAVRRDLRVQAKSFCIFADACPHISRIECAKCFRYFVNLEEYRVE